MYTPNFSPWCRRTRNGWWKDSLCCWWLLCAVKKKKVNMHFKFSTRIGDWDLLLFLSPFPIPPLASCEACITLLKLISIYFISPKELYKHLNPNSWIFHANLNVLPEDFIKKTVSSSLLHSFSIPQSSPHFAQAIYVYQHDTVVSQPAKHWKKRRKKKNRADEWLLW